MKSEDSNDPSGNLGNHPVNPLSKFNDLANAVTPNSINQTQSNSKPTFQVLKSTEDFNFHNQNYDHNSSSVDQNRQSDDVYQRQQREIEILKSQLAEAQRNQSVISESQTKKAKIKKGSGN